MTFRARPTPKPTRRRARRNDTRRSLLLNLLFGFATLVAIACLSGVLFANWYGDHWAAVASVEGQAISKDKVRDRAAVDKERLARLLADYGTMRNLGRITTAEYSTLSQAVTTQQQSLYQNALNELTQEATLKAYADKHGIGVSDQQVNDQIAKDGTVPEMRAVQVIAVAPDIIPPLNHATDAQQQAAKTKIQGWLDSIRNKSKTWSDINALMVPALNNTGDMGLLKADDTQLDPDLLAAIFALKNINDTTDVFQSPGDGLYRFATVTEISPAYVDKDWQKVIDDKSGKSDEYKNYARGLAIKEAVQESVYKKYLETPSVQRHVRELAIRSGYGQQGEGDEFAFRMMIIAPGHSTNSAPSASAADWKAALDRANAELTKLSTDPAAFATDAGDKAINDDGQWRPYNGLVPWVSTTVISTDPTQGAGLGLATVASYFNSHAFTPNEIVGPIQESADGYVLIQYLAQRSAPEDRIAQIQLQLNSGTPFESAVLMYSEWPDAGKSGDMGWVARYQLDGEFESAIFQAPIGSVSRLCTQGGGGYWLFQVLDQQTRLPDATQAAQMKQQLFSTWLNNLTAHTRIWTDSAGLTAITPAGA